ncbi:type I restriction-modification system subunit M [Acidimicrobiales bacterium]|nr:type I restriction-modification system subunit M [Acidimicrobiales bacterium]
MSTNIKNHAAFIWSVADLLRGDYKQSDYGKVILPFTVLRRLDCVLDPVKADMLTRYEQLPPTLENYGPVLDALTEIDGLWNTSRFDITKLLDAPDELAANLRAYLAAFSPQTREILDRFDFASEITRLDKAGLLYLVVSKFAEINLHPDVVSNLEMGYLYEELIRRFSELSNETAGEHFTPREVIKLMVNLLFIEDDDLLTKPGIKTTLYDPACGTGGMLSVAEDHLRHLNPDARLTVYGQELNDETYAICRSDMMLKGQDASNIARGNSLKSPSPGDDSDKGDQHAGARFDYLLANPPFGVEWKKVADSVKAEHETLGYGGRYGAGLPRINDGSFLFLQHMISKMKRPEDGGSRLAIVFNGSPLITGAAGSGESEIRRWIIENDWLEAVVALPDQLFYNTGISTYFWIVTNRKSPKRRGKVQLIDARDSSTKMRKSLGDKRKQIADADIDEIVRAYGAFEEHDPDTNESTNGAQAQVGCKIFPNETFGFMRITVERPLRVRWEITDDTLAAVTADKKVAALTEDERAPLLDTLTAWNGRTLDTDTALTKELTTAVAHLDKKKQTPLRKAVLAALTVSDPDADPQTDKKGNPEADSNLRDNENVPLPATQVVHEPDPTHRLATPDYRTAVDTYLTGEVLPYVPDAWVDHSKTKIGYEIPLTRHFYTYTPPRPLAEIDAEIKALENEIQALLAEVAG